MAEQHKKDEKKGGKKVKLTSALKRDLQNARRRERNTAYRSKVRTALRALHQGIEANASKEVLAEKIATIYSLMDKGVKKHVFKVNKAARTKARISASVKAIA